MSFSVGQISEREHNMKRLLLTFLVAILASGCAAPPTTTSGVESDLFSLPPPSQVVQWPAPEPCQNAETFDVADPPDELVKSVALVRIFPGMPKAARERNQHGWAAVIFDVTSDGLVDNVRFHSESPNGVGFGNNAVAAIYKWKFRPAFDENYSRVDIVTRDQLKVFSFYPC